MPWWRGVGAAINNECMNKMFVALGIFAISTLAFVPMAGASATYNFGGGMGSQAFGVCGTGGQRSFWSAPSVHSTGQVALPPGTYRPFMGSTTSWQVKNTSSDFSQPFAGMVKLEVIEVAIFGGETIRSSYVRSVDSIGQFPSEVQDNQEFGSFVVPASNTSKFILRATAVAGGCAQAYIINVRVELVSD